MLTKEQKLARAGRIGSSDAAAILGLDPFRSAADVWLEKTGQAKSFDGNENTERGNRLERALLMWAADELGKPDQFGFDVMIQHPTSPHLLANLDAVSHDRSEIIEAKTTVIEEGWGDPGTDEIPERVLVQAHHQFACLPTAKIAHVPVLLPGFKKFDWRLYRVNRNDDLVRIVERSGEDFMEKYVVPRVQPGNFKPSLEVVKRIRRTPKKSIDLSEAALFAFELSKSLREKKTAAEKESKAADAALLAMLADAEQGILPDGRACTYLLTARAGYVVEPCEYRTLRFLKSAKI